jgi:GR25 family glycosyltransferase involved in LPS biosynthesis
MEARLKHHQLLEDTTFIEAIPRESPLVDYYGQDLFVPDGSNEKKWRGELACYASHLKAIRQFLHDGGETALICEDDILFSNNFKERLEEIIANIPEETPLVSMCYMITSDWDSKYAGKDKNKHNLLTLNSETTWGAQMYWLRQDYAKWVLSTYDRPFKEVENPLKTSEVIIRQSGGLIAYPPLVIEDGIDSDRAPEDLEYHHHHFKYWGYEKYSSSEREHLSPLAETF